MKNLDYNKLCNSILSISNKAGEEILEIYNAKDLGVTYKDDKTPLTLADKASNKVIEKSLQILTPNIPILSEEGENTNYNEREKWDMFWLVDTIRATIKKSYYYLCQKLNFHAKN